MIGSLTLTQNACNKHNGITIWKNLPIIIKVTFTTIHKTILFTLMITNLLEMPLDSLNGLWEISDTLMMQTAWNISNNPINCSIRVSMKPLVDHMYISKFSSVNLIKWKMRFTKWSFVNFSKIYVQLHARISNSYVKVSKEMARRWPTLILNLIVLSQELSFKVETWEKHLVSIKIWSLTNIFILFHRKRFSFLLMFWGRRICRWKLQHLAYWAWSFGYVQKKWLCQY